MNILVIDAQGGGVGKQLVSAIKKEIADCTIVAVGTNSIATSAMLKAGADHAATGENAVKVNCKKADIVVGPIGIVIADSLYGEITPEISVSVGGCDAKKVLIPFNSCDNIIAGVKDLSISKLIENAVAEIKNLVNHS